jgi:DNA-binding helix-hairpin-helix protein with protein kinase domain
MDALPPGSCFDSRGRRIPLGKKIGSGGEGNVFEIVSSSQRFVAKIYHKPLDEQKQEKLRVMVRGCNDTLKEISAWPVDLIHNGAGGPVCGFVMPRVSDCEPVHKVYGPTHRKQSFPEADWKFLVRAAKNLAAAFDAIHFYGYVIGDVNEGNILVDKHACVTLIDCDSFQVKTSADVYCCEVGVAQFTPPEILNGRDFSIQRAPGHDTFGLAILIFQLLFMGRHPYSGVYSGKADMPIEKAIAEYRFAFGKNSPKKCISPPPNSVGLAIVPTDLAELFEQAFTESGTSIGRPTANKWWNVLNALEKHLKTCTADSSHKYYAGLTTCPWCKLEYQSGVFLFLSQDAVSKFDLTAEWRKIASIKPPGPAPAIQPRNFLVQLNPLPPGLVNALAFTRVRQIAGAVMMAGCLILVLAGLTADYLGISVVLIVAAVLFLFPGRESAEKERRKTVFENARYNWGLVEKKWKKDAGDEEFNAQLARLKVAKRNFEAIEREYKSALSSIQHTARERQLITFLESCFIDSYNFLRIGANRKATLRSFGIETAADITRASLMRITELDTIHKDELLEWRHQMENKFRFDPSRGMDKSDIQPLIHKFQPKLKPLERELHMGPEALYKIQQAVLKNRVRFQPMTEKSAKDLAQAHADYEIFTFNWKLP